MLVLNLSSISLVIHRKKQLQIFYCFLSKNYMIYFLINDLNKLSIRQHH